MIYKVFCDEYPIYDAAIPGLEIFSTQLDLELNKTGSFTFTIYPNHPYFDKLEKLKSTIKVYQNDFLLFRGRILNDEQGFYNEKQVSCEGELAFLLDSIQRPYDFQSGDRHTTIPDFFEFLIENHNEQVSPDRQFIVGNITVTDPNNYIVRSDSTYLNTWDSINQKLLETNGGFLFVRHEEDGNFIDYLEDFSEESGQRIEFGKNLLDLSRIIKGEDVASVIIPLGAKLENSEERITIKSVNSGNDYLLNQNAVNAYGKIAKTVIFDDVSVPSILKSKGQEHLNNVINFAFSIELTAFDLSAIDVDEEAFRIGKYVGINTNPHGINSEYLVKKISINILDPESLKISLGTTYSSFTEEQSGSVTNFNKLVDQLNRDSDITKTDIGTLKSNVISIEERIQINERTPMALQNGWENYGSGYETASFWVDSSSIVHLDGLIKNGSTAANTVITSLPDGFRPRASERIISLSNNNVCSLEINLNGQISILSGSNASWLSLSGITFRKR